MCKTPKNGNYRHSTSSLRHTELVHRTIACLGKLFEPEQVYHHSPGIVHRTPPSARVTPSTDFISFLCRLLSKVHNTFTHTGPGEMATWTSVNNPTLAGLQLFHLLPSSLKENTLSGLLYSITRTSMPTGREVIDSCLEILECVLADTPHISFSLLRTTTRFFRSFSEVKFFGDTARTRDLGEKGEERMRRLVLLCVFDRLASLELESLLMDTTIDTELILVLTVSLAACENRPQLIYGFSSSFLKRVVSLAGRMDNLELARACWRLLTLRTKSEDSHLFLMRAMLSEGIDGLGDVVKRVLVTVNAVWSGREEEGNEINDDKETNELLDAALSVLCFIVKTTTLDTTSFIPLLTSLCHTTDLASLSSLLSVFSLIAMRLRNSPTPFSLLSLTLISSTLLFSILNHSSSFYRELDDDHLPAVPFPESDTRHSKLNLGKLIDSLFENDRETGEAVVNGLLNEACAALESLDTPSPTLIARTLLEYNPSTSNIQSPLFQSHLTLLHSLNELVTITFKLQSGRQSIPALAGSLTRLVIVTRNRFLELGDEFRVGFRSDSHLDLFDTILVCILQIREFDSEPKPSIKTLTHSLAILLTNTVQSIDRALKGISLFQRVLRVFVEEGMEDRLEECVGETSMGNRRTEWRAMGMNI